MHDFRLAHGATELLLVRHADADHPNLVASGEVRDIDLPLSAHGLRQTERLTSRLRSRSVHAMYTSPLKRAYQTAEPLARATGVALQTDARLREVEIAGVGPVSLPDLAEIAITHGGWSHLPGTESSASIRARMCAATNDIIAAHPRERVVLVSHAGAINAYIASLLGLPSDFFFPAGNTSISIVRARDDRRLVVTLNDTAHLETR